MTDYLCVDGPLAGQTIRWTDRARGGASVVIEVVDVGQHPDDTPFLEYLVESRSRRGQPGRLRFAPPGGRRGAW